MIYVQNHFLKKKNTIFDNHVVESSEPRDTEP